jgi:hypothetical protein
MIVKIDPHDKTSLSLYGAELTVFKTLHHSIQVFVLLLVLDTLLIFATGQHACFPQAGV